MYKYYYMIPLTLCMTLSLSNCEEETGLNDYIVRNFALFDGDGCDLKVITGTLDFCVNACDQESNCAGFSRDRDLGADDSGTCFLKTAFPPSLRDDDHSDLCTYVRVDDSFELAQCSNSDLDPAEYLRERVLGKLEIEWIPVEGGMFMMGSDEALDESPKHPVFIPSFEMMKMEVTVGQYRECVEANICSPPAGDNDECNWVKTDKENHPMNCVTWIQMSEFAEWAEGRLPSEAEWEYAAKSQGQEIYYPWGTDTVSPEFAVYDTLSTAQVCSKTDGNTEQGLCDMAGNVWEWVQDEYHPTYEGAPTFGDAWCSDTLCSHIDVDDRVRRVMRGGYWRGEQNVIQTTNRGFSYPKDSSPDIGGRLVRGSR